MVTLIVGVLFAVGIIAAVAAVFLTLGDRRTQNQATHNHATISAPQASIAAPQEQQRSAHWTAGQSYSSSQPSPSAPNVPGSLAVTEKRRPRTTERLPLSGNGEQQLVAGLADQVRVLTGELQTLQQQSDEIERRLALLSEIAVRLEQMQNGHVDAAAEFPPVPDPNR